MPFITEGKTNLKYVLIVVILASIVGGGILGYYYLWIAELETRLTAIELKLPEKVIEDETATWKTYQNEIGNFSIKYPEDWFADPRYSVIAQRIFNSKDAGAISSHKDFLNADTDAFVIIFTVYEKDVFETLDDFILAYKKANSGEFFYPESVTEGKKVLKVAGKDTVWLQGGLGPAVEHIEVFIPKNEKQVIVIEGWNIRSQPVQEKYIDLFNQMLSTFKFIEEGEAIKEQIRKLLPSGVFLREIELLPDISPESYLVIYIEDPKFDDLEGYYGTFYMSCPESTEGQAIEGIYHLALFQDNIVVNDVIIPSGSLIFTDPEQAGVPLPPRQKLVFKNTKQNINWMFSGLEPSEEEKFDLEEVKLVDLEDFTGDGQKYEFKLTGPTIPCGHTQYLIAGYNEKENQAIIYPIREYNDTFYWHDNFLPDSSGKVEWYLWCGDHGSNIESYELFQFNPTEKAYILVKDKETPCFE